MNISAKADLIYNDFSRRLTLANKKELAYNLTKNFLLTSIIFFALGFLIIVLEAVFHFRSMPRTIMFWGFISTFSTTLVYFTVNYFLKRTGVINPFNLITYSQKVGSKFEGVKDSLSNSLSLYKSSTDGTTFSSELVSANLENVDEKTKGLDFSSYLSYSSLKKYGVILAGSVMFYAVVFAILPGPLSASVNRLINYNYNFTANDLGISFEVTPGNAEVVKGGKVTVRIIVKTTKPDYKPEKLDFIVSEVTKDGVKILSDKRELSLNESGYFSTDIENINNEIIYYAEFEDVKSDEYKITVADYPVIKSFTVTIQPPEMTGMPSKTLSENEGDIFCPAGSRITFAIKSSKTLSSAGVNYNGQYNALQISEAEAGGSITAGESGTYKFELKDTEGNENKNGNTYNIKVMNDEAPKISIIEPEESNYVLKAERELLVRARITDDYGFSKLVLGYRKSGSRSSASGNFTMLDVPIKNLNATSLEVPYVWSIAGLGLRSGDAVEYYMEVTDNTGHTTRSDVRTLQYRSLQEILKQTEKMTEELKSDLSSVMENTENLQQQVEDLKKKMQNNEELGLNEQKKQDLQKSVENLQNKLNDAQNKIDQSMQDMKEQNMLNDKTLEQYMKMQEMFNKINTPEFKEMLKKLQEALKNNNREELKEAMKNFNFDEEAFKKQMEKVMELMKKIENLQKFGELTQKMDDITKKQEELKNETENADKNDRNKMNELSDKQKDIKNQTDDFKEQLKKLIDDMNKLQDKSMNTEDLENLKKQMEQKNTQSKMDQSSKELQKGDKQNSENTQQDIMNDLNQMNDQMQKSLSNMMDSQDMNNKLKQKMGEMKKKLEEMSKRQQEIKDNTGEASDKQDMQKNQKDQKQLQDQLNDAINDMMGMTKSGMEMSPEMGKELGNAYNKMDNAGNKLGKGDKKDAMGDQGDAKQSLDKAGEMLGDMMGKMGQDGKQGENGQKGNGKMGQLMQQLANLIAQQQGLNGKMGQMGENGQTGKDGKNNGSQQLSSQQKEELGRLQLEQEQISKSMEQLNKEFEEEKQRSGEKVLGNLNQVQKEMEEVIKEMQQEHISDELMEKQNRILSRMLDAQLSQREKDFEQKRESKPGQNYTRNSPPEIVLSGPNSFNALKEDFLRLQKEGYTEDYEALITKYLMELKKSGYGEGN